MALAMLLLGAGALVLYLGAEVAVRGAARLAAALGVTAFALGALLFGIDPEGLGAALTAAGRGDTEIAGGGAFGTVLFLFTAAFGLALLMAPQAIPAPSRAMLAAPGAGVMLAALVVSDRFVDRLEGLLLVVAYAGYVLLVLRERHPALADGTGEEEDERREEASDEAGRGVAAALRAAAPAVLGLGLVYAGAWLLVGGGARIAARTELSAGFVGAAIVGALTSLDEVLLEVLPVRRGTPELATGNLMGTLAAFTTGVLGLAALVRPLTVDTGTNLALLAVAALYAIIATTFFLRGRAGRALGVVVLAAYAGWLVYASSA